MTENTLARIMHAAALKMRAEFDQTRMINHRGEAGSSRERILADFLTPRVPGHVGVAHSGEILAATGKTSPQCDVVLYDRGTPPLFDTQASRIFVSESVYGVIEVKSTLDKKQLADACEKIREVKLLPKTAYYDQSLPTFYNIHGKRYSYLPTFGSIFAFDGGNIETITSHFASWCSEHSIEERPDSVWVLGKGWLQWSDPATHNIDPYPRPNAELLTIKPRDGEDILFPLAIYLNINLANARSAAIRLADYAGTTPFGVGISRTEFSAVEPVSVVDEESESR